MSLFTHAALLALGGAIGTLLRAGLTSFATRCLGVGFPWGTLLVNVLGSLAFGLIVGLARTRGWMTLGLETLLLVGTLGGFTTYSSFAFQSAEMLESGRLLQALAYIVVTNAAAIAAIWLGIKLAS
ncbi:MAG: CrcB family protein [Planctomycetota bacterium]